MSVAAGLVKLGIADKISGCSYMRGEYAYLEEDCDATLFMNTKNIDNSFVTDHYSNKQSKIRNYEPYKIYSEKEKDQILELKSLMELCKNWSKKAMNKIKNASLSDLKYWQSIYNF